MTSFRPERLAEQIHQEATRILRDQVKDPRVDGIVINEVKVSRDLGYATLFYTLTGASAEKDEVKAGLQSITSFLRRELGRILQIRQIPVLRFSYDTSVDYGRKIDDLLRQVQDDLHDD